MFIILFYDSMVVTVPSGHIGVFFNRFVGGTDLRHTYGEGIHLIFPWDNMFIYDCRSQKADYDIVVLVEGGLRVVVHSSIIWRVIPDYAPVLHVSAGHDYQTILIAPAMTAAIRTSAGLQPDLYSSTFNAYTFEEDILKYVQNFLNKGTFIFEAILIREIELPERMLAAINDKFAAEQMVLQQRYHVQEAYERFKQQFIDAESLRNAALIVNLGLTENFLRYQGIEATKKLAESDNAKLVIIGDKDGLPLILNPDSLSVSQPNVQPPSAMPLSESGVTPELGLSNLGEYLGKLNERLDSIAPIPQFESKTLPQTSGIQGIRGD
jgi:regulator of protease activity HflC (stomatin/prohibitin superfamily)